MATLPHDYNIDDRVKVPIPKIPGLAIGEIKKVLNEKTRLREEAGYFVKIENPTELKDKLFYFPQRFIKELL